MRAATSITIRADHPALAGHFPGFPVLPAVLLLDETLRALETDETLAPTRWRIGRAKFLKPVRPGEALSVEHETLPNGSVRFSIFSAGLAVAQGMLIPAADQTADGQQTR